MFKRTLLGLATIICFSFLSPIAAQNTTKEKTSAKKDERPSPPMVAEKTIGNLEITINYNAPGVKGRTIWGDLVPYNKVWRTGANEATTFEISRDAKVEGNGLYAGKYALFTIPGEKEWTIIFNKVSDQWGAYKYEESKDAIRFTVTPEKGEFKERLEFNISEAGRVTMAWENVIVAFNIY